MSPRSGFLSRNARTKERGIAVELVSGTDNWGKHKPSSGQLRSGRPVPYQVATGSLVGFAVRSRTGDKGEHANNCGRLKCGREIFSESVALSYFGGEISFAS